MRLQLLLACLVACAVAQLPTAGIFPPNSRCSPATTLDEHLPLIGLTATGPPRQCVSAKALPSKKEEQTVQKFRIDLGNLDNGQVDKYRMQFMIWNNKRKPDATWRTTVEFGEPTLTPGLRAQGYATVDAQGKVTGITITNPGYGYESAPSCAIKSNGAVPTPRYQAACIAVLCNSGGVANAVVITQGQGYPASAGNNIWDADRLVRFELVHTEYPLSGATPHITRTNLLKNRIGNAKDTTRCPCADDPAAAICACVPIGYSSDELDLPSASCVSDYVIELEAAAELEYAVAGFFTPIDLDYHNLQTLPMGQRTQFFTPLSQKTKVKIGVDGNGTNPARSFLKELRVTLETPLSSNWLCEGFSKESDCAVRKGHLAKITSDLTQFPYYHTAPYVTIDPARKGISSISVTAGGNYGGRPNVRMQRNHLQSVGTIQILSGGKGYQRPPRVAIIGGGGTGAEATAFLGADGAVTSVTVNEMGQGYNVPAEGRPIVKFFPEADVASIDVARVGSGYESGEKFPGIVIDGPNTQRPHQNARAKVNVNALGQVDSISVSVRGYGYEEAPKVHIGSRVYTVQITNGGSGYTSAPTVTFKGGVCTGPAAKIATASATITEGVVTKVTVDATAEYRICSTAPTVEFSAPPGADPDTATGTAVLTPGSGATAVAQPRWLYTAPAIARAVMSPEWTTEPRDAILRAVMHRDDDTCSPGGPVIRVDIIDPGSNYVPGDTLVFDAGAPTAAATFEVETPSAVQATATATIDANKLVSAVHATAGGSGYSPSCPPKVSFWTPGRVVLVKITKPGSGYTRAPVVTFASGPSTARASATIDALGRVTGLTLEDSGAWYEEDPEVTITPRYEIVSVVVENKGSGYDPANPPAVSIQPLAPEDPGSGAKAVAEIGSGGCVERIRVTFQGSGYAKGAEVVIQGPPGAGTPATAAVVLGGGQDAEAVAVIETGDFAKAEAVVNNGAVSSIVVTKRGLTYNLRKPVPTPTLSVVDPALYLNTVLNAAGIPTGLVNIRGTPSIDYGVTPPEVTSGISGVTMRAFLGGSNAADLLSLSTGDALLFPAVSYTAGKKIFTFRNLVPQKLPYPYYTLNLPAPADGSWKNFPAEDFVKNAGFGADNDLNAIALGANVVVEAVRYPELYKKGSVTATIGADPIIYQISAPRTWSRIRLSYWLPSEEEGKTILNFRYMSAEDLPDCAANTWCDYSKETYLHRKAGGALLNTPNDFMPGVLIEVSVSSCRSHASGLTSFSLEADVAEFVTEGECNWHYDCQPQDRKAHPTQAVRARKSANANSARFRRCVVDERFQSAHKGVCVECSSDCDCELGQYCHKDTGALNVYGYGYTADNASALLWGTCQTKDPKNDIFRRPCRDIPTAELFSIGTEGINHQQWCGRALYFNATHSDPALSNGGPNRFRESLWTGLCYNHVCYECTEAATSCGDKRICVDGFWQIKSGNSRQGAIAADQIYSIKNAVDEDKSVSRAVLAFTIIIALIVIAVVAFSIVRAKRAGMAGGVSGVNQQWLVPLVETKEHGGQHE